MKNDGNTLKDGLAKNKGKNVFIGARSSFFFIGPADEAMDDLPLLSAMLKHIASPKSKIVLDSAEGEKLGRRKVKAIYEHDMSNGVVILVEGKEFGTFWTRNEYLSARENLLKSI